MDKPVLDNQEQLTTEEVVFGHIGEAKAQWETLFAYIQSAHPDFESEWRFYRDGNRWLMKTVRKKKTIFWLSVVEGGFLTTFYFGDKAEPAILDSGLSQDRKDAFIDGKRYGKIRGITVQVADEHDLEDVKLLIVVKLRMK